MTYYSFSDAWVSELGLTVVGAKSSPRGIPTRERQFVQFEVTDPLTFPLSVNGREFKDVIGVLEGLSLVGEFNVPELFTDRVAKFGQFMDDGVLWGAYGQRAHGTMGDVVNLLKYDQDSRQAVVTFFDSSRDLNRGKKDIPCTLNAQFFLRTRRDGPETTDYGRYLDMRITMRSNDMWLGTPYDFVQFGILQASVAQALGVRPGRYVHSVGSLHVYERDMERASKVSFHGAPPMQFPLWGQGTVAGIQSRARMLALGQLHPKTPFEYWAQGLLR